MDRNYYHQYYEFEKNHWWFRARAEILRSYMAQHLCSSKPSIANIGAATGGSIEWLSELGEVTSLEYDPESARFIREELGFPVTEGSILHLPYEKNSFDVVCAFDVIEHVEDDRKAMMELVRICKVGGSVLVTVPAHMSLWSPHDVVNHHFRRYNLASLMKLVEPLQNGNTKFITYFNNRLYYPILLARKINNFLTRKNEAPRSDFESFRPGIINDLLYRLMSGERHRIRQQEQFRTGVSILLHWEKNS